MHGAMTLGEPAEFRTSVWEVVAMFALRHRAEEALTADGEAGKEIDHEGLWARR